MKDDITIIINSYKPNKIDLLKSIHGCLHQININVKLIVSTVEKDPTINYVNDLNYPNIELVVCKISEHPGKGAKGIYFQLNKALEKVTTKYVSYFSSNDIIYPTKSYNEIKKIQTENTIFCFSKFLLVNPETQAKKPYCYKKKMNYENLLTGNYINDCATIDITKLDSPLQFNYIKYENTCYWHLWLSLLQKNGEKCMSINDNIEWEYIRDISKSQSLQRNTNNALKNRELNIRKYMLSTFLRNDICEDEYNNLDAERFWWYNEINLNILYKLAVFVNEDDLLNIIDILENKFEDILYEIICFSQKSNRSTYFTIKSKLQYLKKCYKITYLKNNIINWHFLSDDKSIINIEYTKNNVLLVHKSLLNKVDISHIFLKHDKEYIKCIIDEFNLTHLSNNINFFILNERGIYNFNQPFATTAPYRKSLKLREDIKQIVLSITLHWIKPRFLNTKKPVIITKKPSKKHKNTDINYDLVTLLVGYYHNERIQKLKDNFKNKLYIVWGGSDCLATNNKDDFKDITHICISKIIYNNFMGYDKIYDCLIDKSLKDLFPYEPIKKNSSIYFYCPADAIYKKHIINFLKSKIPFINFYTYENKLIETSDIINLYKKCFLGLRFTCFDGNANTSIELGLMGRKCICLNDYPNCVHWTFENLYKVIDFIKKEYELLNTDNNKYNICARQIREECIEYINKYSNIL